ncbi:MAG: hypothetical protein M3Z66_09785 [Chloroflexota bacterium]|nr:hypothetical protein [Chloroflexota bacterium]
MSTHVEALRLQARSLPESPGVYFWKDGSGHTLYIGKAVNLRSRVMSYFYQATVERRTRDLLLAARSIEFELTATELEALFRESALIKQMQPDFNRALRVSKKPCYIRVDRSRADPWLEVARDNEDENSLYFGPFRSLRVLRETMAFLHDVLPLRKCTAAKPRCRPCMYFQMNTCAAPALDDVHRRRHDETIQQLFELLDGRSDRVSRWLEHKRDRLSESLCFEQAAEMQGRLLMLQHIQRQHLILEAAIQCRCVVVHHSPSMGDDRLLLVAHGHVLSQRAVSGASPREVTQWIRAHDILIQAVKQQQTALDAAGVLERWIACNRQCVRWVAVPHDAVDSDLLERVTYVLGGNVPEPVRQQPAAR